MQEPIKLLKRTSMGLGANAPKFDKMEDFTRGMSRYNPLLMHDYGRNIYHKGEKIGYALDVRICGYRGLPINAILQLAFEVDGEWIPDECKHIWYEGKKYKFSDIGADKFDNNWYWKYTDYLRVFFEIPGGIDQGIHRVKYGLALRDHYSSVAYCEKDVTIV
ncbi:MAG: hypothetical protein GX257_10720 [Clostridiales bacterium]|jgi:hypothetical protein|nr:hypothetical protein [Clostridiales bacterium]